MIQSSEGQRPGLSFTLATPKGNSIDRYRDDKDTEALEKLSAKVRRLEQTIAWITRRTTHDVRFFGLCLEHY